MPREPDDSEEPDDPDDWRSDADDPETSLNEAMDAAGFPPF